MEKATDEMKAIKAKAYPEYKEIHKYVRYLINVLKYDHESILEDVKNWDKEIVVKAINEVDRENLKPKPKRYFVSLKSPLDDENMR